MPRGTPTDRRAAFVHSLRGLLAERGYAGASVGAIARDAGLAPGLLHYYFPSKEALLVALIDDLAAQLQARVRARQAEVASAAGRVRATIDACLALGEDADPEGARCWVVVGAEALRNPAIDALWQAHMGAWITALAHDLAEAGAASPQATAAMLVGAVLGAWQLGPLVPPATAAATVQRLLDGVLP